MEIKTKIIGIVTILMLLSGGIYIVRPDETYYCPVDNTLRECNTIVNGVCYYLNDSNVIKKDSCQDSGIWLLFNTTEMVESLCQSFTPYTNGSIERIKQDYIIICCKWELREFYGDGKISLINQCIVDTIGKQQ